MPPKMQMGGRQSRPKNSKQSFLKLLIEFKKLSHKVNHYLTHNYRRCSFAGNGSSLYSTNS